MSTFATPIQQAIYTRLTNAINSANIYDDVPDLPEGQPTANFPYITIGEDDILPWDTDDTLGGSALVVLHIWSRTQGKKETKEIMAEIYDALNRQAGNLSATGFRFVDCLHEFSTVVDQSDGVTRHGICRYRLTVEKE